MIMMINLSYTSVGLLRWYAEKWSPKNGPQEKWFPEKWSLEKWSPEKWSPGNWSPENWSLRFIFFLIIAPFQPFYLNIQ